MDSIKVELCNDGDYIGIRTHDRNHGARGRFLIARRVVIDAMFEPEQKATVDMDCGHFAEIWRTGKDLWVRITWLSESSDRYVWEFRQTLKNPCEQLKQILPQIGRIKYLFRPRREVAKIIASESAGRTIRHILEDKHTRRAFIKAMRDCFQWPNEVVTLYNDGGYSFYFVTKSGFPKNGGLILHDGERRGHPFVYGNAPDNANVDLEMPTVVSPAANSRTAETADRSPKEETEEETDVGDGEEESTDAG